jgi:uncharacterized RDD family membrane protein YckC
MNENVLQDNPYAAPSAPLGEEAVGSFELAGRGQRLGAALLDGVFLALGYLPLVAFMMMAQREDLLYWGLGIFAVVLIALLVVNCVLLERNGQTIAKKLLGIKVVRSDGSKAGLARIFAMRFLPMFLLGFIPLLGPIVGLVDSLMIFRDNRRCLHDDIADTIVVRA